MAKSVTPLVKRFSPLVLDEFCRSFNIDCDNFEATLFTGIHNLNQKDLQPVYPR